MKWCLEPLRKYGALSPALLALVAVTKTLQAAQSKGETNTVGMIEKLTPHFRQAFWGESMDKVLEKESAKLSQSAEDTLTFAAEVAGVPVFVWYVFEDDKLIQAQYQGRQDYYQAKSYLKDFEEFKRLLTVKYGTPADKSIVHNEYAFKAAANLSQAVKFGYITISFEWYTADTRILLQLYGKEYEVNFLTFYYSKEFRRLMNRRNKKEDADALTDF